MSATIHRLAPASAELVAARIAVRDPHLSLDDLYDAIHWLERGDWLDRGLAEELRRSQADFLAAEVNADARATARRARLRRSVMACALSAAVALAVGTMIERGIAGAAHDAVAARAVRW